MAAMLNAMENDGMHDIQSILQEQKGIWKYENIMLMDESGIAVDTDNKNVFLSIDAAMREDMLAGKTSMSTAQLINNREYIIFAAPLDNVVLDGRKMTALVASYAPASFDRILSMGSFDARAYSQIITRNGTVVTRSSSPHAMTSGYNIFASLQHATLDEPDALTRMGDDISAGRADQISFVLDGVHRYMVYTPIDQNDWYLLTFVPVQVVNARSDMLLRSTVLICGLITLVFAGLIAALTYSFSHHRHKLEQIAYVDPVTGGNTAQRFYDLARASLDAWPKGSFALVFSNMEKFKVLNEQVGHENCDAMLRIFEQTISSSLEPQECMGRLAADQFCMLLRYRNEHHLSERFAVWLSESEQRMRENNMLWGLPLTEFGVFCIENSSLALTQMLDRAKLALRENTYSVGNKIRYSFYDDEVRRLLFREKQLEDMMEQALANNEFQVYLQPKYRLPSEVIGGAEALVRWVNPSEGMIYPNEFIPLFEKNGFIVQLDLWVFEEVCRTIRSWEKRGITPVKVSVNCSRVHFKNPAFLSHYIKIAARYGIRKDQIEIELTESVVLENITLLSRIIEDIRNAGFGCSMDDFGSGYSSLNLIQSIPVDTLKLDKIFFRDGCNDLPRTEAVVGSIVRMGSALSMSTVAEGVEHREQVEMLKRVGCGYIQGYVFAKPMKVADFETLAFGEKAV